MLIRVTKATINENSSEKRLRVDLVFWLASVPQINENKLLRPFPK